MLGIEPSLTLGKLALCCVATPQASGFFFVVVVVSFVLFVFFEAGSLCVLALTVLELILQTQLASN